MIWCLVTQMKRIIFGTLALMVVVASIGSISAFGGKFFGIDSESREKIAEAIETNDYNAWKEAMSAQLTEENFNMLVKRHKAIYEERAQRETMEQALEEGDYEAWKEAVGNQSVTHDKILDEDDFERLVQLHQARQDRECEPMGNLTEKPGFPGGHGGHGHVWTPGRGEMI